MIEPGTGRDEARPYGMVEPGTGRDESRSYGMIEPGTGRDEARPYGMIEPRTGRDEARPYYGWFDEMGGFQHMEKGQQPDFDSIKRENVYGIEY